MGEHRVDVLEDRVERLRERTERLQEEFVGVRSRVRALEGTDDEADQRSQESTDGHDVPEWLRAKHFEPTDERQSIDSEANEATDQEVEAAVRHVETDGDHADEETADEKDTKEIIVA